MKRQFKRFSGLLAFFLLLLWATGAEAVQYKVKKGDNLFFLSKKFGLSIEEIKKTNSLNSNILKPGQSLTIQNKRTIVSPQATKTPLPETEASVYIVKKGDTLSVIAKKTGVSAKQLTKWNNITAKKLRIGSKLLLVSPSAPVTELEEIDDGLLGEDEETIVSNDPASEKPENEAFLGKWNSAGERQLLVRVATGFLGAPYRLGGSTVRGIDCSAFVRKMYDFFDIHLPRTAREQASVGMPVERKDLVEGDLVFFRTKKPIGHVGIYIGNNEFVHASYRARSVRIDSLDQPYFQKRFQRAVRVKDLDGQKGT